MNKSTTMNDTRDIRSIDIDLNKSLDDSVKLTSIEKEQITKLFDEAVNEKLALVKYSNFKEPKSTDDNSSFAESFPLLVDIEGNPIDFTKPVTVFEGVEIVSRYLELNKDVKSELLNEGIISKFLQPIKDGEELNPIELMKHVDSVFKKHGSDILVDKPDLNTEIVGSVFNRGSISDKPLGAYGDITLNETIVRASKVNWSVLYENKEVIMNGATGVSYGIGYGLMVKSFVKYVHNIPEPVGIDPKEMIKFKLAKNRQLLIFSLVIAPLTLVGIKMLGPKLTDIFEIQNTKTTLPSLINNDEPKVHISLGFIGIFYNKFRWLKYTLLLTVISVSILKFLGLDIWFTPSIDILYYKLIALIVTLFAWSYEIINLILLSRFLKLRDKKELDNLEMYPEFIVNWLTGIFETSKSKNAVKAFKSLYYTHLTLYSLLLLLVTLFCILG